MYYIFLVGYTMSDIRYKWNDGLNSVQISSDVSLPQFKVLGHRQKTIEASLSTGGSEIHLKYSLKLKWTSIPAKTDISCCSWNWTMYCYIVIKKISGKSLNLDLLDCNFDLILTGNYSRLACEIQFVRSMGYYLIQIYIPSSLIVVISWVSFWLNRGATPARVGLGVTTVLTMTTLMASTNAALPKISYVKSIDVYLGFCFFMVFASLLGRIISFILTILVTLPYQ